MRAALPGLVVLCLLAIAAILYWSPGNAALPDLVAADPPRLGVDASGAVTLETARQPLESPKSAVSVELRFVDADSGVAIAAGRVFDVRGELLGTADIDGVLRLADLQLNALVFGADGYLVEHYFDRPDEVRAMVRRHAEIGHLQIMLEPDTLTLPAELHFVGADAAMLPAVSFQMRCLAVPAPTATTVPTGQSGAVLISPELRAAWQRHALLSTLRRPDFNPELLHFGAQSASETFHCAGRAPMRFLAAGRYLVEARAGELFGHQVIDLHGPATSPLVIRLGAGAFLAGQVVGAADSQAVGGAQIVARRDGQIVTSGEADAAGRFRVGPLADGAVVLEIHHRDFAALQCPGVHPGAAEGHYALQPLPQHRVFGVVRRRPHGAGIAGAEVKLTSGLGTVTAARTDATGRFELASTLTEPGIEVIAKGFLAYAEMINANGEPLAIELLPDQPEARRQAGLSALISGTVTDAEQRPVANCPVRIQAQTPLAVTGVPGRRIVRGATIPIPDFVITDANGVYRLEWPRSEAVTLAANPSATTKPTHLTTTLGHHHRTNLRTTN